MKYLKKYNEGVIIDSRYKAIKEIPSSEIFNWSENKTSERLTSYEIDKIKSIFGEIVKTKQIAKSIKYDITDFSSQIYIQINHDSIYQSVGIEIKKFEDEWYRAKVSLPGELSCIYLSCDQMEGIEELYKVVATSIYASSWVSSYVGQHNKWGRSKKKTLKDRFKSLFRDLFA